MKVPLDEVFHFGGMSHAPTTGAITDADSTPTFEVFEEATDTDIGVGGNMTKRTSKTGNYRGSYTVSAANGFEVGKWYETIMSATVGGVAGKAIVAHFQCVAAESVAGVPKMDVSHWLGTAAATPTVAGVPEVDVTHYGGTAAQVAAGRPQVDVELWLGSAPNALVSGRVDASVGAMAANVMTAAAAAADLTTELQSGLATAAALTTIDDFLDTEIAALLVIANKLDTALELDGAVYRLTLNALELAPTGGSAPTAAAIADAVWDEATAGHTTGGTFGEQLKTDVDAIKAATDLIAATAMTESYAANGVAPTMVQALYSIQQMLQMFLISGTSLTVKKLDNATTAFVVTLNNATTPTGAARS